MPEQELISADEFCAYHNIEFSFMRNLQEYGMIELISHQQVDYIPEDQIGKLERILRLHNDLEINMEGIDTISHLLQQISRMQEEIISLRNKLRLYEDI